MSRSIPTGARVPLANALTLLTAQQTGSFAKSQQLFLEAMWLFDTHVANGVASQGDIQNGKGDFLNDFLSQLLKVCSGKDVHTRPNVAGLSFRNHKLDIAYPATGPVELTVETKATGVPKHPRNQRQSHPEGRAGSADLEKRIKEAAFKNIDIKAEIARQQAKYSNRNEGTGSLTTNAVGIRRQSGRGAGGREAVGCVGRVVGADRAALAEGRAALSLSGPEAAA